MHPRLREKPHDCGITHLRKYVDALLPSHAPTQVL